MFLATAASVGHRVKRPEFIGSYFTGTTVDGANILVTPSSAIPNLEVDDMLIACITQSDGSVPYYPGTPSIYSGTGYSWSYVSNTQVFSNDTNDSASAVYKAPFFGGSYTINFGSSNNSAATIVQLLAFRNVNYVTNINAGTSVNGPYVYFPTINTSQLNEDGILQFGGGGQYRANYLGTYPNPGGYDNFDSYQFGTDRYMSGTVGYGFYAPKTLSTSIPAKTWDGSAYNSTASSTFDITLRLEK